MVGFIIWSAESYLDITKRKIQPMYGYPLVFSTFALAPRTIALTSIPLIFGPLLYYYGEISKENTILFIIYVISTAPYLIISIPALVIVYTLYMYAVKKVTGLKTDIATAPAGTIAFVLTYIIALTVV